MPEEEKKTVDIDTTGPGAEVDIAEEKEEAVQPVEEKVEENNKLKYEIQLDDEIYKVLSPSTVFIPKGIKHKARFLSGKGIFVCIILSGKYTTSK